MKFTKENDTLTLYLAGEVNSFNADSVEEEIQEILNEGGFSKVVIDMDELEYMSSAGIRIVVAIKQKYDDLTLTKVGSVVYDVFAMVGLDNLIRIEAK